MLGCDGIGASAAVGEAMPVRPCARPPSSSPSGGIGSPKMEGEAPAVVPPAAAAGESAAAAAAGVGAVAGGSPVAAIWAAVAGTSAGEGHRGR